MPKQNGLENSQTKKAYDYSNHPNWAKNKPKGPFGRKSKEAKKVILLSEPEVGDKLLSGITNRSKDPKNPSYRCQIMKDGNMKSQSKIRTYEMAVFIRQQMLDGTWVTPDGTNGIWHWGKATSEYFNLLRHARKRKQDEANLPMDESIRRTAIYDWSEKFVREYFGADMSVNEITAVQLERFRHHAITELNWSATTINSQMGYMMKSCKHAFDQGNRTLPAPEIPWCKRKPQGRTRVFTPDEEASIKSYFTNRGFHRTRDFFDWQLRTGIRPLESFKLTWGDICFKTRKITVQACHSKTGKERFVPMLGPVHDILVHLRMDHLSKQPSDLVDETAQVWSKVRHFTSRSVRRQLQACRDYLGLTRDKEFVWYACRHTCTSRLLADGVSTTQVMAWMGWASMATLDNYQHHLLPEWDAAIKKAEDGEKVRQETKHRYYDVPLDRNADDVIDHQDYNIITADAHPELLTS